MLKKKRIHLFFRKPHQGISFSVENWYIELIKNLKVKILNLRLRFVHSKVKVY